MREKFYWPYVIPAGSGSELDGPCYLSLALVCSALANRLPAAATTRSLVAKKSRCHVPVAIFLSDRIGRLRAPELTRTQADFSCTT